MKLNLSNEMQAMKARNRFNALLAKGAEIELKEIRQTRTIRQNSALHLYFTFISDQLNDLSIEFQYQGITGKALSLRYTPILVKDFIWRPIQIALFDIESTKNIGGKEINQIIDVLTEFFAREGVVIEFPSFERLMESKK